MLAAECRFGAQALGEVRRHYLYVDRGLVKQLVGYFTECDGACEACGELSRQPGVDIVQYAVAGEHYPVVYVAGFLVHEGAQIFPYGFGVPVLYALENGA